jgi:hypothetical protein
MTARVQGLLAAVVMSGALAVGCGGKTPGPDVPDAPDTPDTDVPSADDATGDVPTADAPSDGIIRDADGDGTPDGDSSSCDGLDKTKCQISSGCAWSDGDKCVEAKGSMM